MKALAIAVLVVGCTKDTGTGTPDKGSAAAMAMQCTSDDECTLAEAGCCDTCSSGGRPHPMRKDAVAAFLAAQPPCPPDPTCTAVMSNDPACYGRAKAACVSGRCGTREVTTEEINREAERQREEVRRVRACTTAADCAFFPDGCCGCGSGGRQLALRADQREVQAAWRASQCESVACPAVVGSDHPSCSSALACVDGQCTMTPPAKQRR